MYIYIYIYIYTLFHTYIYIEHPNLVDRAVAIPFFGPVNLL